MATSHSIFSFKDYRQLIKTLINEQPGGGHGEMSRLSEHLQIHPSRLSQVLSGTVHFTLDQASDLGGFFGFSDLETEYFITLVQLERAGSPRLRQVSSRQLERIRKLAGEVVNRVSREKVLTQIEKAVFYSGWKYSAIRLATSNEELQTISALADYFKITPEKVREIVDFLLKAGLCVQNGDRIQMGPKTTHLESSSPLVLNHHRNWRIKAMQLHESLGPSELAYTCPVSINVEDELEIREMLMQTISKFLKKVTASEPVSSLNCLTLDWFRIRD